MGRFDFADRKAWAPDWRPCCHSEQDSACAVEQSITPFDELLQTLGNVNLERIGEPGPSLGARYVKKSRHTKSLVKTIERRRKWGAHSHPL